MMGEVIHDQHATYGALDLLPSLDPGKCCQTVAQLVPVDSQLSTHRVNCESVLHVVATDHTQLDNAIGCASVKRLEKTFPIADMNVTRRPLRRSFVAVVEEPAARRTNNLSYCSVVIACNQTAARRNDLHQPAKRSF